MISRLKKGVCIVHFLKPYLICALILLAMFLISRILIHLLCFFTKLRFFADGVATVSAVAAYMICRFGEDAVFSNRYFPSGDGSYERIPLIVVMRSGIAVIEARQTAGTVSTEGDTWRVSRTNRYGEVRSAEFPDPSLENEIHMDMLALLFQNARFRKIPRISPITVMPTERIRFHGIVPKELISPMTLPRRLGELERGKPLSKEERRAIIALLERTARTRRQIPPERDSYRPRP